MSTYLIGDIHGCYEELKKLLMKVNFNPVVDTLWLTGDLVARGPCSLEVLRLVRSFGKSLRMVLGNHELNLLSAYSGISTNKMQDCIASILRAPDATQLIDWLRYQPLLQLDESKKIVMTHAGITPQWSIATAKKCALELEEVLKSERYKVLLDAMYVKAPNSWNVALSGPGRLRFITNAFTRMRYCFPDGALELNCKDIPEKAPTPLRPWFAVPGFRVSDRYNIVFGHWSALMGKGTPHNIYGLDTGCCWGGALTLLRWEDKKLLREPYSNQNKSCNV